MLFVVVCFSEAEVLMMLLLSCLVSCTELIKQSLVDDSKLGEAVRPYVERNMMGEYEHKCNADFEKI